MVYGSETVIKVVGVQICMYVRVRVKESIHGVVCGSVEQYSWWCMGYVYVVWWCRYTHVSVHGGMYVNAYVITTGGLDSIVCLRCITVY